MLSLFRYLLVTISLLLLPLKVFATEDAGLQEIAPGIFVLPGIQEDFSAQNRGHVANKGFILGAKGVAVIDTGSSFQEGLNLRHLIKGVTDKPIKYVILTHMHPDHVLGAAAFSQDKPVFIGHQYLEDALVRRSSVYLQRMQEILGEIAKDTRMIYPTETVELGHGMSLDLGDRKLELSAYPTGHTNNDITVYDRNTGTLWLSDLLFVDRIPVMDGSLLGWIRIIDGFTAGDCRTDNAATAMINLVTSDAISCVAVERVVPGHGPNVNDWNGALQAQRRYLANIRDGIREVIKRGGSITHAVETVAQEERERWLLFDQYHGRNVTAGFVELEWE